MLQYFPPPDDPATLESLNETLRRIITGVAHLFHVALMPEHQGLLMVHNQVTHAQLRPGLRCEPLCAGTEVAKNVNKNNAQHAIVFEAVALALALEADAELLISAVSMLGKFISVREPNIKYLGLENLVRLAEVPAVADVLAR